MHYTEYGRRMSSVGTELGKKNRSVNSTFEKIASHSEYGVRMSSVKTEVGEITGM